MTIAIAALLIGVAAREATALTAPVVSITGSTFADSGLPPCNGSVGGPIFPGSVTFSRTGTTGAALSIPYDVSGPVSTPHGTAEFIIGSASVTIAVTPTVGGPSDIHVTIGDGVGYEVGIPATIGVEVIYDPILCLPTTTTSWTTTTTITVPNPTTTSSSTAVQPSAAGSATTVTAPATTSSAAAVASSQVSAATLPKTGASDATGLIAFALSLVGAGVLLIKSRHPRGPSGRPGRREVSRP